MRKSHNHTCKGCGQTKVFRSDQQYCSRSCVGRKNTLIEQNTIKGDTWEISLPKSRIHTLPELIKFFEIDEKEWTVERFVANKWEMGYIGNDGNAAVEPLYQVKAFLKRRNDIVAIKEEIEDLKSLARLEFIAPARKHEPEPPNKTMFEVNLTDHHFGKLAWGLETGYTNYDVKIATAIFNRALDTLLERGPMSNYDEIWFVVGNDLFNSDDTLGRTTAGTQVESDVRHEKTYVTVRTLLVQAIEKLRFWANKVKVIIVPGNHDSNATWHMGDSLQLYFTKYEDVEVDNRPCPRKYHVFGNSLIGFTHGHQVKLKELPLLMAAEQSVLFGQTKFHEWHTGHKHHDYVEEKHGIKVRILPTLCSVDAWHSENGYVGNLRSSQGLVWDIDEGLIGTVIYTDSDSLIEKASEVPTILKEGKNGNT